MPRVDGHWYRTVLSHVPTAVVVVTGVDGAGDPVGFACGSFFSASLEPPLVGFCVATTSTSWTRMADSGGFCVNVLADDQEHVSSRFARSGGDKFTGMAWHRGASARPYLGRAVAWIDCTTAAVHEVGDHIIVVGSVSELLLNPQPPKPLVFHRGGYGSVTNVTPARHRRAS